MVSRSVRPPFLESCGASWAGVKKKISLQASERDEAERAAWRARMQAECKAETLVFVDESGCNLALTPRYGWAPRGERAVAQVPRNRGPNTTVLAALTPEGLQGSMIVEGAANTEVFLIYLDKVLCPSLHAGQTVVMDNLNVHRATAVRERIEARGCQLVYLPAYSRPAFNPIEEAFSKLKTFLRRAKARTREALESALAAGLQRITAQDARHWFTHCGFAVGSQ
jgi:transposase